MKKRFLSIIIFAIFFLLILSVKSHANSINSINMKINIDKNGNAKVEEEWDATLSQGTEGYRAFKNSKYSDISISDFSVETDNGKEFTTLSSWNTSASFDSKSYKCGIHKISNGVELCWGISKYGTNKYILKYTINNFVSQYTDNQGIYLNLINLDQAVGEAKITISSDVAEFSLDNSRIWGFGYEGDIVFSDGDIVMNSDGRLNSSSYMVALVRFEEPLFNISKTSKYSFDEIYDTATENVDMKKHNTDIINGFNDTVTNVGIFFFGIIGINVLLFLLIIGRVSHRMKYIDKEIVKFEKGKHISNSETELWREIPCDNNLSLSYWVATTYKIEKKETLKRGLIGAILLKWINENRIEVKKNKKGLFNLRDNKYSIFLSTISEPTDSTEYSLYRIIKNAAGKNNILEPNELKRYCSINYTVLDSFFYSTLSNGKELARNEKYTVIDVEEIPRKNKTQKITHVLYTDKLRQEAIKLKGLKKFLSDYSLLPEREYMDVKMWNDYLIFANLLGIADKVSDQFKKLYPDFNQVQGAEIQYSTDLAYIVSYNIAREMYRGSAIGKNAAARESRDYSGGSSYSGGGGSSFSSGGGSSGGSSGGGFR